jgi:hypothetical protein
MKAKDHDTIVDEHYRSPKQEIVGGKTKSKYKKHKRINPKQLLQSVMKKFRF